jgi:tRNA-dihydrouridine synthase A
MQEGSSSPLSKRQRNIVAADDGHRKQLPTPRQQCRDQKSLHIAPMIRVSNREFRQLIRILSKRCVLWTEMVVDETIYYCSRSTSEAINREKVDVHLDYDRSVEHPIVCQIGGIDPLHTAFTSKMMASDYGYDEVNLNMGCPSDRVSGKGFGAVLMKQVDQACELVKSLKGNCGNVPISVKLRIGVDDDEDFEFIRNLISHLHDAGCDRFYMHARKVHLKGLNPAQNRSVPPLNYPIVYRLCEEFPHCDFWINGGISGLEAAKAIVFGEEPKTMDDDETLYDHSVPCKQCKYPNGSCIAPLGRAKVPSNLRGCMLGRAAMDNPSVFWDCDRYFYGEAENPCTTRREVLDRYIDYLEKVYPRRCCDDRNDVQTNRIPAPSVVHTKEYCEICSDWRKHKKQASPTKKISITCDSTLDDTSSNNDAVHRSCHAKKKKAKAKITTHVVRRSLGPILGLFFGLSTSRSFRRKCEELMQDARIRNCGPAFVLVSALRVVPNGFLDAEFVRTEDLQSSGTVEHVSPQQRSS